MKQFSIFLLTCLGFATMANAQRNADLSFTLTSPANGATITGTQSFNFGATLTNNGPDTIKTTDTLALSIYIDNSTTPTDVSVSGQTTSVLGALLPQALPPGASGTLNQSLSLVTPLSEGTHNFCAVVLIVNRSADSLHETAPDNNKSCASITAKNATAINDVNSEADNFMFYPNPSKGNSVVKVNLSKGQQINISFVDINGREVYTVQKECTTGDSTFEVNTEAWTPGIYLCRIQGDAFQKSMKVIVSK